MDTNMTFRMDSEVKSQMAAICAQLGMTTSTAFNIFANAFVRANGMPFSVTIQEPANTIPQEKMLADTDALLSEFAPTIRGWRNDLDQIRRCDLDS